MYAGTGYQGGIPLGEGGGCRPPAGTIYIYIYLCICAMCIYIYMPCNMVIYMPCNMLLYKYIYIYIYVYICYSISLLNLIMHSSICPS